MTTVAQLINYLKTLPPNLQVNVVREYHLGGYNGYATEMTDLILPDEHGYSDNCEIFGNELLLGER